MKLHWIRGFSTCFLIAISFVLLGGAISAQGINDVRYRAHWLDTPNEAILNQYGGIQDISLSAGTISGPIAVGWTERTDRPGSDNWSAFVHDFAGFIDPASTFLGAQPAVNGYWDSYDLLGPPEEWDKNWDNNTVHLTYDQLIFASINSNGLVCGMLWNGTATPDSIPVYLDLNSGSGILELNPIPLPTGSAGGRAWQVNEAGEILVELFDASGDRIGPCIFEPATATEKEIRTQIPFLNGVEARNFNSLGQIMVESNGSVQRYSLDFGTSEEFDTYIERTINSGITESLLGGAPDMNEFGQVSATINIPRGKNKGQYGVRYGGLPGTAVEERRWEPTWSGQQSVEALNDSGDALGRQSNGDAYYYHEGSPNSGDETYIPSIKDLILVDSDPDAVFFVIGRINQNQLSNRDATDAGWMYGNFPNGLNPDGSQRWDWVLLQPVIPTANPGISVSPSSGLVTSESETTDTFDVVLNTEPTDDVTIGISSSNTTEGTVSAGSLTFTPANWDTAQTVSVTGVNDDDPDNPTFTDDPYTIVIAAATSDDLNYHGLDPEDVSVTNLDNDGPSGGSQIYFSDDTPLNIRDRKNTFSTINVADDYDILGLNVLLDITHSRPSDLTATLTGPDGTNVSLPTLDGFIDVSAAFSGTSSLGDWTLKVRDNERRETGTLNGWSITVDY